MNMRGLESHRQPLVKPEVLREAFDHSNFIRPKGSKEQGDNQPNLIFVPLFL